MNPYELLAARLGEHLAEVAAGHRCSGPVIHGPRWSCRHRTRLRARWLFPQSRCNPVTTAAVWWRRLNDGAGPLEHRKVVALEHGCNSQGEPEPGA